MIKTKSFNGLFPRKGVMNPTLIVRYKKENIWSCLSDILINNCRAAIGKERDNDDQFLKS